MKKHIFHITPVSLYDVPALERFLEEQAAQGLRPSYIGTFVCVFTPGAQGSRCRLEYNVGAEPPAQQRELYEQYGWTYADTLCNSYDLYTAGEDARELYSDGDSRSLSLDVLEKRLQKARRRAVAMPLVVFAILFALVALIPASRFDVQPDRWVRLPLLAVQLTDPALVVLLLGGIFDTVRVVRDCRRLAALRQALSEGREPPAAPDRNLRRENAVYLAVLALTLVLFAGRWATGRTQDAKSCPRPHVTLTQLEQVKVVSWEALYGESAPSWDDNVGTQTHWSLLSMPYYTVNESGYALSGPDNYFSSAGGDGYRYAPDLSAAYFRLTIPAMAKAVAKAQLDEFRLVNLKWSYREETLPGADFVLLAKSDNENKVWQMAAIGVGGRLAVYRYAGLEQLSDHLAELAAPLEGF